MDNSQLETLINAWLNGNMSEDQSRTLQNELRHSPDARRLFQQYCQLDSALRDVSNQYSNSFDLGLPPRDVSKVVLPQIRDTNAPYLLTGVLGLLVTLVAFGYFVWQQPGTATIARITGLSGPLRWTGDGGQVDHELVVGTELSGGTIDGLSPESWFRLEFNDGSRVTISGSSMLTFSDVGQKQLHLKSGLLSAEVVQQPAGKPMLVHTRSATLTVLGTSFEVEAGLSMTAVNVTDGQVKVERLTDREIINLTAMHRVVASADREFLSQRMPGATDRWRSSLHLGPQEAYGNWVPAINNQPASLKAIPYVAPHNTKETLYLFGIALSKVEQQPVVVRSDSRFIVRGRLSSAARLFFGLSLAYPDGKFAGKFLSQTEKVLESNRDLEAVFDLRNFVLDPSVMHQASELPSRPDDLLLTGVWGFTKTGAPAGLEIVEVELLPPLESDIASQRVRSDFEELLTICFPDTRALAQDH